LCPCAPTNYFAALLEQLEKQFASAASALQKLTAEVGAINTRAASLEAAHGIASPAPRAMPKAKGAAAPAAAASAAAAPRTLGGKLSLASSDNVRLFPSAFPGRAGARRDGQDKELSWLHFSLRLV